MILALKEGGVGYWFFTAQPYEGIWNNADTYTDAYRIYNPDVAEGFQGQAAERIASAMARGWIVFVSVSEKKPPEVVLAIKPGLFNCKFTRGSKQAIGNFFESYYAQVRLSKVKTFRSAASHIIET